MTLSEAEILQILKMLEESSFGELRLETGELKLVVRKKGFIPSCAETDPVPVSSAPAQIQIQQPVIQDARTHGDPGAPSRPAADQEGTVPIKAPMLGTVYRRPSPDAPPYVEIGSFVEEDDTVCLIEVMKVFTAVKAGVRGYITEILIETTEMVEYGQPLLMVRPEIESAKKDG